MTPSLIIAITSAVALGWKIYSDVEGRKKVKAKIDAIVKYIPDVQAEMKKMDSDWKKYTKSRKNK